MHSNRSALRARLAPIALLLIAIACIQSGASLATSIFDVIGAAATTSLRLILAALMLLAIFRPWRRRIGRGGWRPILVYGVALGSMNFLFYQALARIPLGIAVALEFTGPLAVALFGSRRRLDLVWVALAVAGLAILLWPERAAGPAFDWLGALFALGAGACWAMYILFGRQAGALHGIDSAVLGISIGALVIAPIGLIGLIGADATIFAPPVLLTALGVAILSTALPYTLEMVALPRLPAQTFGTLMSLEPAFGALSGLLFLGQTLDVAQWLAIAAIIAASMGTTVTGEPAGPVESPYPD